MSRPKKCRRVMGQPGATFLKPKGVPLRLLQHVSLEMDEMEALRLADLESLSHEEAARQMTVSRATFGRIVALARKKIAEALMYGKAIRIEGGSIEKIGDENQLPHYDRSDQHVHGYWK